MNVFFVPGIVISLLTFPGVMLHEWAHKFFCNQMGVPVFSVKYFQLKNPAGYVQHAEPKTYKQTFWISIGPLVINSAAAILLSALTNQTKPDGRLTPLLFWLAVSAGMHAFPSDHDMQHVWDASKKAIRNGSRLHFLALPLVLLIRLANLLRFFWADALYAIGLIVVGSVIGGSESRWSTTVLAALNPIGAPTVATTAFAEKYRCRRDNAALAENRKPSNNLIAGVEAEEKRLEEETQSLARIEASIKNDPEERSGIENIERHNARVSAYNARLGELRVRAQMDEDRRDRVNAQIEGYNKFLNTNCVK